MAQAKRYAMADAVRAAYRAGEDDEAMEPIVLVDQAGIPLGRIQDGDYVIFYDLRGEREIELTQSFVDPDFDEFAREEATVHFATMIEYDKSLGVRVAFPPVGVLGDTLSETVSGAGLRQAKIAESEKSIHLNYFLNGKRGEPFPGEERVAVPSPHVLDYTQVPELSAAGVAAAAIEALQDESLSLIVTNFANVDVVGHSEDSEAIKQAVATVDQQIGKVVAAADQVGVAVLILADHGTVEKWLYPDGAIDTGHTNSPVPCVLVAPHLPEAGLRDGGDLTDVAPTLLQLLGVPKPEAMTGETLIVGAVPEERGRVLLLIADGWGHNDDAYGNLIAAADTPVMDRLQAELPTTRLAASGPALGMPEGTVGNSEVGHLHMGAGRRIYSDRVQVNRAIEDGSFFENDAFLWAMRGAKRDGKRLHLLGIISFYSSHGSVEHLKALLRLAVREEVPEVYVHGMLGRRGERPESGALYVQDVEQVMEEAGLGRFVSIIGRFWSLDREENWDRIEKSYRWLVDGSGRHVVT